MIKEAKAGDFVYAYKFNCENDTCNIKKIKVKEDFNAKSGFDIIYGYVSFISPKDAFWTYEEAEARYLVDLEKSLKLEQKKLEKTLRKTQKKIERINKILSENQIKTSTPYLGDSSLGIKE